MKTRKNKKELLRIIISLVFFFGIFGLIVFYITKRIISGWTNNDTLLVTFGVLLVIVLVGFAIPFYDWAINKDTTIINQKSKIYRLFLKIENSGFLEALENDYIEEKIQHSYKEINNILQKKDPSIKLTTKNEFDYFSRDTFLYYGNPKLSLINVEKIEKLFRELKDSYSNEFEALYRNVHNNELIKQPKLYLFEFILPFIVGFLSLFTALYEVLKPNGGFSESLITYILILLEGIFSVISFGLPYISKQRSKLRLSNDSIIERLKSFLNI